MPSSSLPAAPLIPSMTLSPYFNYERQEAKDTFSLGLDSLRVLNLGLWQAANILLAESCGYTNY